MQYQDKLDTNQQPALSKTTDDVSFQDIVQEFRLWKKILRKNFIKLLVTGLIGAGIGFGYAYMDKPIYTANTRFMLKNEGVGSLFGGQMTGLTSLLGGGQMGTPLERTAEVIASDRIVGKALLRTAVIEDSSDLLINHFIRLSNIREKWQKDKQLAVISFDDSDKDIKQMSLYKRKAYKIVKSLLIPEKGNGVVKKSFDKKSGVLTISCTHTNEEFAIVMSNVIYDELSDFFIEQMTYSSNNNAEVLKQKIDSIDRELYNIRRNFASQTDQSLGLLLQQDKVSLKELGLKEQMLTVMYAEAQKNYEGFRFMNQAAMPSLTLIEAPYSPINPSSKSKKFYTLIFGILSFVSNFIFFRFSNK